MIDSHCHLEMRDYEQDFPEVLKRMRGNGVTNAISIGSLARNERIEKTIEIVSAHDFIKTTLGVHPKSPFKDFNDLSRLFDEYYFQNQDKIVAVGETGLDYFLPGITGKELENAKRLQEELFRFQIELAVKYGLPLIVHIRDAYEKALEILEGYINLPGGFYGGVVHCFSSKDTGLAGRFLELGFFISFSGNITYKNSGDLRALAKDIPDEKILIETDSPYLSPDGFRGKRNEPSYARFVLKTLSELKEVDFSRLDGLTTQNTVNLFSLDNVPGFYPAVAYKIRNSVYVNLTNKCTNRCSFCPKYRDRKNNYNVRGYNLLLKKEPSPDEVVSSVFRYYDFSEVVFCGLGEPTLRLDALRRAAAMIKENGKALGMDIKTRLDTDGLASAVYGRNIPEFLGGVIDSVSVSLNAHNREFYNNVCMPELKKGDADAYAAVIEFIRESRKHIGEVTATAVDLPGLDVELARKIAGSLGAKFRLRQYDNVG